MSESPPVAW